MLYTSLFIMYTSLISIILKLQFFATLITHMNWQEIEIRIFFQKIYDKKHHNKRTCKKEMRFILQCQIFCNITCIKMLLMVTLRLLLHRTWSFDSFILFFSKQLDEVYSFSNSSVIFLLMVYDLSFVGLRERIWYCM